MILFLIHIIYSHSLGRNPIRSRKSFKDRPTSVYSTKSSSSIEEPSSLPVGLPDGGFFYDLDGNIQEDDNVQSMALDSCGNIPEASENEMSRHEQDAVLDHSFA